MQNKKVVLGVAAGVAVLAVAGLIVAKKENRKRTMKHRLKKLSKTLKESLTNFTQKLQDIIKVRKVKPLMP
ncbi:hypothetical protein LRS05_06300 [Flavobacterium sp. J372]|uniref:hypothetical protein n=1 Tax=Flavobacterium sp. J372 TaxID=2898436 RepID=UPI002150DB42|nr:hypothetical protein [Flavobacterium sp. J372]MCR5861771.1 hypothetical protein [Flavobacterium sp. J372]